MPDKKTSEETLFSTPQNGDRVRVSRLVSGTWTQGAVELGGLINPDPATMQIGARVVRTTNFTDTPPITMPFESVIYDVGGFWNSAQPTRLTVPVSGFYLIGAHLPSSMQDITFFSILLNGSLPIATFFTNIDNASVYPHLSTSYRLNANDYVEILIANTGTLLAFSGSSQAAQIPVFHITRIS